MLTSEEERTAHFLTVESPFHQLALLKMNAMERRPMRPTGDLYRCFFLALSTVALGLRGSVRLWR